MNLLLELEAAKGLATVQWPEGGRLSPPRTLGLEAMSLTVKRNGSWFDAEGELQLDGARVASLQELLDATEQPRQPLREAGGRPGLRPGRDLPPPPGRPARPGRGARRGPAPARPHRPGPGGAGRGAGRVPAATGPGRTCWRGSQGAWRPEPELPGGLERPACAPTSWTATGGCGAWPGRAWAPASPTTWAWARPSRPWPCCWPGPARARPWCWPPPASAPTGRARPGLRARAPGAPVRRGRPGRGAAGRRRPSTSSCAATACCPWRPSACSRVAWSHRGPGRGPEHQERPHQAQPGGDGPAGRVPPGALGHPGGEPPGASCGTCSASSTPACWAPWSSSAGASRSPSSADQDPDALARLRRTVAPFLLRRTKAQVLKELPPRTEIVLELEPSAAEARLPGGPAPAAAWRRWTAAPGQTLQVLAALMRLRRACCNPALVQPGLAIPSSKLEAFLDLVEELRESGHRALVFSQFVDHLALLRAALDAARRHLPVPRRRHPRAQARRRRQGLPGRRRASCS